MASSRVHKLLTAGSQAPEFRLERLGGGYVSLPEIRSNGPVLVAFFKVTCPTCQFAFPFLERIHQPGTLPIYGISQNDADDTHEFNQEFGVTFPTLLDNEHNDFAASNAFGISNVPTIFLLERDGTISRAIEGWNRKEIEWLGNQAGIQVIRPDDRVPDWKPG